jgi:hypothetical protein
MDCISCESNIRGGSGIVIFTDSLYNEAGRFIEHLTTDNLCSVDCLKENLGLEPNGESCQSDIGQTCSCCNSKFELGHSITLGWAKPKSQKRGWHKVITTRYYCGHGCLEKDLSNEKSPLTMDLPKKAPKKSKAKKKK